MEGAGGLKETKQIERWWEAGVRIVGPVWSGSRFCGSNMEPGGFTREGLELLEVMAGLGMTLDVSHMSEKAVLQAVDAYEGNIVATHANARALLKRPEDERHLSDLCIHRLVEREAVIGILPFGKFLRPGWTSQDAATLTTFDHIVAHIDHICQIAGDAHHVGLGSDFDGGWGWPHATAELNSIADFQKLAPRLAASGYNESEIGLILGENWRAALERNLPPA
jgi:membrane dipeptidase